MTTLIQDVQALLESVGAAGGAWYAANTINPPTFPFIAWQRIVSTDNNTLSGPSDLQNTRIQVEAVSRSNLEADALMNQIEAAFLASTIAHVRITSQDIYEEAIRAVRVVREFSVWATN